MKLKLILLLVILAVAIFLLQKNQVLHTNQIIPRIKIPNQNPHPLSIESMRQRNYPGSDIVIEESLASNGNYNEYVTSYKSDGLKIFALLTVPQGEKPKNGWPVIIFNHGYIAPEQYKTTERYVAYVDGFARSGYIVFKPDYRGNGNSQGEPEGAYYSTAYSVDVFNAVSSIKRYKDANPGKIGMWGHSLGGNITLRNIVVDTKDVKAAVIWGGVVGSYEDLMFNWQRRVPFTPSPRQLALRNRFRQEIVDKYKDPRQNPEFWNSIDPTHHLSDLTAPIQLDVGGSDEEVPVAFSKSLYEKLKSAGKVVEYYEYSGSDHNISQGFNLAMQRSVDFFNRYLK